MNLSRPQRPDEQQQHRQQEQPSTRNMLKSLLPKEHRRSKSNTHTNTHTQTVPLLPPDHPHSAVQAIDEGRSGRQPKKENANPHKRSKSTVSLRSLGRGDKDKDKEKSRDKDRKSRKEKQSQRVDDSQESRDERQRMKKTKSSTSLRGLLGKMNRSSKDLADAAHDKDLTDTAYDKENQTPPASAVDDAPSQSYPHPRTQPQPALSSAGIDAEINRYTPQDYSPSKQRDFSAYGPPNLTRPPSSGRPKSLAMPGATSFFDILNRPISRDRAKLTSRGSDRSRCSRENAEDRKVSSSSNEQPPPKQLANMPKRGSRVMAAVAAFDERAKESMAPKEEPKLDPKAVDAAFEAVLDSRNVPENMRQKMRTLTLRVKADFVKQDKGAAAPLSPSKPESRLPFFHDYTAERDQTQDVVETDGEQGAVSKSERPRSKTLTSIRGAESSIKKQKSDSRPNSIHIPKTSTSTISCSRGMQPPSPGRAPQPAVPDDFVAYLQNIRDPAQMEVGRLHKLRLLLRNETVAWVDSFISLGGMVQVVDLLHRIMQIEWREEHEDQLLHEALLCLKGLCTTEVALKNLDGMADSLFPKLLAMLFDEEKKGPSEFTTRGIIVNVLFAYLDAARESGTDALVQRAHAILGYLADPKKPDEAQPIPFVLSMRQSRPYKVWCTEVSNVSKEVFWIFLHHLNIIPLPKQESGSTTRSPVEGPVSSAEAYAQRHFPGDRPPVPAAPYIGGVEWDATTYMTAHLDLLNGLIASLPTRDARNQLRSEFKASGFEKVMGGTLRTCKEKFYCGVHSGLRNWIAAAIEDKWDIQYVRYGPSKEEMAAAASPKKSPKKSEPPPQLDSPVIQLPKLTLGLDGSKSTSATNLNDDNNDGWLM